jgi:hypothetical protein
LSSDIELPFDAQTNTLYRYKYLSHYLSVQLESHE